MQGLVSDRKVQICTVRWGAVKKGELLNRGVITCHLLFKGLPFCHIENRGKKEAS
jgi:hypothetical protein